MSDTETREDRRHGPVTILFGKDGGKYPEGNSLLVEGSRETWIVDPSLGVVARKEALPRVDRVVNSHCHEDHVAGNHLFPDQPWHCHEADAVGFRSLDDFMAIYGLPEALEPAWRKSCVDLFHYTPREEVERFADGDLFDLGDVTVRVVHTPGHTRGHSALVVAWGDSVEERLVFLGDIDLSSFGPYYGDAWSDLEDFERSLRTVRALEAGAYLSFHHIGLVDRVTFEERLDRFATKIVLREAALVEYLDEPRSLDEIVAHRFVYRPGPAPAIVDAIERRSMGMHLTRLLARDRVEEVEPGRYLAVEA